MKKLFYSVPLAAVIALAGAPAMLEAQETPQYNQAISANPFGLLLELFNAEYERVVTESSTAGIGGSFLSDEDTNYANADVFWRYYPGGKPLEGLTFGAKVGLTKIDDEGTFFGYGFDTNYSWLLGKNNNFYVGVGFGLKRLVGTPDPEVNDIGQEVDELLEYVPTFRIINIGFAF